VSTTLPADLSCPRCGAHVRAGSDWCTLCYTDLRPADQRPPVEPAVDVDATAPPTAVAATPAAAAAPTSGTTPEQQARGSRGKHAKPAPAEEEAGAATPEEAEVLAAQMLAELAVHESGDPLGRFGTLIDTPGKKVALMVGGGITFMMLLFTVMTIFGVLV
jgi:hypothetical protein